MISLGCAKNQVNSEQMLFRLQQAGYRIKPEADHVDLVVINTCGFIDSAKEEAIGIILETAQKKEAGTVKKILVTGCLSERYKDEMLTELPEIDGILGNGSFGEIVTVADRLFADETVESFGDIDAPMEETGRVLTTPPWYAYLAIAEGCDNRCSYCVIPKLRGKYRSRPMDVVLDEAKDLAARGVKELIVVAQDTSRYGMDLDGTHQLPKLLEELCKIDGFRWIRVHYLYPEETTDEIISVVAREEKIVNYLDIPIQHINNTVLKRMNRRGDRAVIETLFAKLRAAMPDVAIRTSLIAGLPYEDEAAFEELLEFLKEQKLLRAGAFVFSPQEGTAAEKMPHVDEETAIRRAEQIQALQQEIMQEYNENLCGTVVEALCEGYDEEFDLWFGRTRADSPDVDGRIWFTSEEELEPGEFYQIFVGEVRDGEPVGSVLER